MASLVRQNGVKTRKSSSVREGLRKTKSSEDDTALGNALLSVPDVGLCTLTEELAVVKGLRSVKVFHASVTPHK